MNKYYITAIILSLILIGSIYERTRFKDCRAISFQQTTKFDMMFHVGESDCSFDGTVNMKCEDLKYRVIGDFVDIKVGDKIFSVPTSHVYRILK